MSILVDVLGEKRKHSVMADTWGHCYPEPKSKHVGKIIIAHGDWGGTTILDYNFPTLSDSPQTAELVRNALDLYEYRQGIYELSCTLWFFKSCHDMYLDQPIGKIIKPTLKTLLTF